MTLRIHSDQRGMVMSFVVKAIVVVALLGLAFIEGGAVVFARLQAQDIAESAAAAGAGRLHETGSPTAARDAALLAVHDKDPEARLTGFKPLEDGRVRVRVTKQASTFIIHRIGFLEGLAVARGTAVGSPPNF